MKQRNVSLDRIKGWAILVVVFVHIWRGLQGAGLLPHVSQETYWAVSSSSTIWCMPAFFFVSGLLYGQVLEKRHGIVELAGKFDRIIYPYLIWSLVIGVVEVLSSGYRNGSSQLSSLWAVFWEPQGIFWFLYALFDSYLLTEFLVFFVGVRWAKFSLIPIGIIFLLAWNPTRQLPFALPQLQLSFIYFAVGVLMPVTWFKVQESKLLAIYSFLAALVILCVSSVWFGQVSSSIRSVSPNLTMVAISVVGLLALMSISLPASWANWLSLLGERSMDVYLLHLLIIAPLRVVLHRVLGVDNPIVYFAVGLPLGLIVPVLLSDFLRRIGLGALFEPPNLVSAKNWVLNWQAQKSRFLGG